MDGGDDSNLGSPLPSSKLSVPEVKGSNSQTNLDLTNKKQAIEAFKELLKEKVYPARQHGIKH